MKPLAVDPAQRRYHALIGTGGIGSGVFFALHGNHTLGREESRGGRFVERRDYCKLHITAHYMAVLMGSGFTTLPIGKVGDDAPGRQLLHEMANARLDLRHVAVVPGEQTLYSFCFVYPDGSGGNLTVDDSACAQVDPAFIAQAEADFAAFAGRGVALAMPEVSLAARRALLELGTRHRFLRAASFLSGEMPEVRRQALLDKVDLLAINLHEAMALAAPAEDAPTTRSISGDNVEHATIERIVDDLQLRYPALQLSITAAARGSWTWDGHTLSHIPALPVPVASTAGAGDAHFAGILAGLAAGLSLAEAHQLGALVAALSVTSADTIHFGVDQHSLAALAASTQISLFPAVRSLLEI